MARPCWSFIYGLGTTKYFEAALQGTMTGAPPFSFGAVLAVPATGTVLQSRSIFGNATYGTSGFGLRFDANAHLEAANGTVEQVSGTALADADNTYATTPEGDLLNNYKSLLNAPEAPVGGQLAWPDLRAWNIAVIVCNVPANGNQETYVNGRLVAQTAIGLQTSTDPVRIGLNAAGGQGMGNQVALAGCFYHGGASDPVSVFLASMQNRDVLGGAANQVCDYVWSVKRGNFNSNLPMAAAPSPYLLGDWASVGARSPITMALSGGGTLAQSNLIGVYDLPAALV